MKTHSKDVDLKSSLPASENKLAKASESAAVNSRIERLKLEILSCLKKLPEPGTEAQIFRAVKGRRQVKLGAISALVTDGVIRRQGTGRRGQPFLYSLAKMDTPDAAESKNTKISNPSQESLDASEYSNLVDFFHQLLTIKMSLG